MFGLPDHHLLSQTVAELTRPHARKVDGLAGTEPPLLDLLATAIASTSGRGSAPGGSTRAGAPLDVAALQLQHDIYAVISEHWPGHGDLSRADTPAKTRLEQWVSALAGSAHEMYLLEFCTYWVAQIRELLEPTREVPVRGAYCPGCGALDAYRRDEDGGYIRQPALTLYPDERPVRARCQVCAEEWTGLRLQLMQVGQ